MSQVRPPLRGQIDHLFGDEEQQSFEFETVDGGVICHKSLLTAYTFRRAKLEAPHAEQGNGHTTARPVGRRISEI